MKNKNIFLARKFKVSDLDSIKRISKELYPEWFTKEALVNIPRDIQFARCFVIEMNSRIVGFVSAHSYDGKPMIGWLGVDKKLRGAGIGRLLLKKVENELKKLGYKDLSVKTVGECLFRRNRPLIPIQSGHLSERSDAGVSLYLQVAGMGQG